jgi:cation-transporting P-type ATPase C
MMDQAPFFVFCHAVPGRLRVKVEAIRRNEEKAATLAHWLTLQARIREAAANPVTGSVIVYYNSQDTSPPDLLPLVEQGIRDLPKLLEETPPWTARPVEEVRIEKPEVLAWGVAKVAGITGFLGLNLLKSLIWGTPFSPAVITGAAIAASLPLWRRALADLGKYRFVGLNPLLSTATFLAIATGEAMTALEVVWILEIGELLEEYVADRSRRAVKEILQVAAKNTYVLHEGVEVETPIDQVQEGDIVAVHAMEKIPVDGVVIQGEALVDQAHFTGRSEPELKRSGDAVYAGTIVQDGKLQIRAEKVGEATYLAQIIHLVEQSLVNRPQMEKQVELLAGKLTRMGLAFSVATLVLTCDLSRVFAVMIVMACPCATILAASTAVSAALANAAEHLMLIKGGLYLERFKETDCFCFDKTGTVTTGIPEVREVAWNPQQASLPEILSLAAAAELHNPHPLGRALVKKARDEGYNLVNDAVVETVLGRGVRATIGVNVVLVGNRSFMIEEGVATAVYQTQARELEGRGQTLVYVAKNGKLQGIIGVAAVVREELDQVLVQLRRDGVKEFHLVSGDSLGVVQILAADKGFDGFAAELLPEEKAAYVERLKDQGFIVAFIGDGVNDAPALANADVGVAMGAGGSETAIATADIALVDDHLQRLVFVRRLSRQTILVIQQNFWLALATDVLGALLAVAGRLTPVVAGFIHLGHAAVIAANSGRLLSWQPKPQA